MKYKPDVRNSQASSFRLRPLSHLNSRSLRSRPNWDGVTRCRMELCAVVLLVATQVAGAASRNEPALEAVRQSQAALALRGATCTGVVHLEVSDQYRLGLNRAALLPPYYDYAFSVVHYPPAAWIYDVTQTLPLEEMPSSARRRQEREVVAMNERIHGRLAYGADDLFGEQRPPAEVDLRPATDELTLREWESIWGLGSLLRFVAGGGHGLLSERLFEVMQVERGAAEGDQLHCRFDMDDDDVPFPLFCPKAPLGFRHGTITFTRQSIGLVVSEVRLRHPDTNSSHELELRVTEHGHDRHGRPYPRALVLRYFYNEIARDEPMATWHVHVDTFHSIDAPHADDAGILKTFRSYWQQGDTIRDAVTAAPADSTPGP